MNGGSGGSSKHRLTKERKMNFYAYKIHHWMFRWLQDDDSDIAFCLFGVVAFVKYKEHTLIKWLPKMREAGKYQGSGQEF
jgi:hypothetical protein